MKRSIGMTAAVIGLATWGATLLDACTAQSTIDVARQARDTDEYRAARDVAEEFVDQEHWTSDELTVEAGIGTLLTEKASYDLSVPNGGVEAEDWRSVLDDASGRGHGIDTEGNAVTGRDVSVNRLVARSGFGGVGSGPGAGGGFGLGAAAGIGTQAPAPASSDPPTCTVRDHMRLHVSEWDAALKGNDPDLMNWLITGAKTLTSPTGAPPVALPPPTSGAPTFVPASKPVAPPAPGQVVDHAG